MKNIDQYRNLAIEDIEKLPTLEQQSILEKLIKHHNRRYFIDNSPEISDEQFDLLTEMLRHINPNSPILYELVGEIGDVEHPVPMLSLEKRYTHGDIIKWLGNIHDDSYIVEPKYDGMAARYQGGILATRGDGYRGENISHRLNELNIKGILPADSAISAFGEVIIPLTYFNENLKNVYKNPRNAVVGIIKAKEVKPEGIKALLEGGVHLVLHDQAKKISVKADDLIKIDKWET